MTQHAEGEPVGLPRGEPAGLEHDLHVVLLHRLRETRRRAGRGLDRRVLGGRVDPKLVAGQGRGQPHAGGVELGVGLLELVVERG